MFLQFHRDLYKFEGYDIGGKYKAADNFIEEEDEQGKKFVRFRSVPAYEDNRTRLEKVRKSLKVYELPCPQLKLLDMGFWQIGFEKDANKGLQIPY